jgi:hypothetical protein
MTRRFAYIVILLVLLSGLLIRTAHVIRADQSNDELYQGFVDPPHKYSLMPFWFWNGKMEGPKIQEQIRQMVDQRVFGAFLHARDGLETPYLSDAWWKAIGAGLEESQRVGFDFNFVDEYDWPSGEARNIWMTEHHQSEVLARNPSFRMKSISYKAVVVQSHQTVTLAAPPELQAVVAARWLGDNRIDGRSLELLASPVAGQKVKWTAPQGDWVLVLFFLEPSMGFDGGYVDLLNPDAMKLFFDLTYGEFHRRFGSYFGKTVHYSFSDHEGDYGYRMAWTPRLFDRFKELHGYDLRKFLPLLIYDGGDLAQKLRGDYLETITQLYGASYWQGITNQAAEYGINRTGHAWEESLQWAAALEGSLFTVERGLGIVGVDSLRDWGRQPMNFKVAESVADFEGRRFMCENQGVQGTDSYLDLERLRYPTAAIATWGVNLFVGHAFNYDASKANYPPDWFHQPYWPYFHYYADFTRRVSYMNGESRHMADLLLYYPIRSMWAHTDPVFSGRTDYARVSQPSAWQNETILINDYYARLLQRLVERQWDYDIADDYYLDQARVEGNELVIGQNRFKAIVLPPIDTIPLPTLRKLLDFHRAGGTILGIRMLPKIAPEVGGDDAQISRGIADLFGPDAVSTPHAYTEKASAAHGHAYFVASSVEKLIDLLDASLAKDVQVVRGPSASLFYAHREKLGHNYYWFYNDSDRSRVNHLVLSQKGNPGKWDPSTGGRSPLFYVNKEQGTEVRLVFEPWQGYYVVFGPMGATPQKVELVDTNVEDFQVLGRDDKGIQVRMSAPATARDIAISLRADGHVYQAHLDTGEAKPITLDGEWDFRPRPDTVSVPFAKVRDAPTGRGEQLGWTSPSFDDTAWPSAWLSEAQNTIRNWNVIGPFPNENDQGFLQAYPPEKEFDPGRKYRGWDGQEVEWKRYFGDEPFLTPGRWGVSWTETSGGPYAGTSHIVQFNRVLETAGKTWVISYARTCLYSPREQQALLVLAADNNDRVWLNHQLAFERLRHPFWYELNDNWADRIPVELKAGWNELLVKVGFGREAGSGYYGFTLRVADHTGKTLTDVVSALQPYDVNAAQKESEWRRWYRLEIPPGCVAVKPLALRQPYRLFVNGREFPVAAGGSIDIQGMLRRERNELVIAAQPDDHLSFPIQFVTGVTPFALTPWTRTGLANYSGTAIYEKTFTIPESYRTRRLMLDLGRLSAVAEVWVNDQQAGTLPWRPYRLDITRSVRPGENRLKVIVTNTEANARAVGPLIPMLGGSLLGNIDVDGLEGPVRIIPYIDSKVILTADEH